MFQKKAIYVLFLLLLFFPLFSENAKGASFLQQQNALEEKSSQDWDKMTDRIQDVLKVYIAASGNIYWNDNKIKEPYKEYLISLASFSQSLEKMWSSSKKVFALQQKRFLKKRKGVKKKCLTSARKKMRSARLRFQGAGKSYQVAFITRYLLTEESVRIANLVFQGDSNVTDGYIDGAIYDFGTDHMIAPPPGENYVKMDPEELDPLIDHLYNYIYDSDGLFLTNFYRDLVKANALLGKARAKRSCQK